MVLLIVVIGGVLRRPTPLAAGPVPDEAGAVPAADAVAADLPAPAATAPSSPPGFGLTARNLLLVINQNEPAGRRLADFYVAQRRVPAGRILALDLPRGDEVAFDDYNAKVVPAVRAFLADNRLADEVTCAVTFYGVPLRVGPRANTPAEAAEFRAVTADVHRAVDSARQAAAAVEDLARQADPTFAPHVSPDELPGLVSRTETAVAALLPALGSDADEARRASRFARLTAALETLYGPLEAVRRLDLPAYLAASGRPAAPDRVAAAVTRAAAVAEELHPATQASARDAAARAKARTLVAANLGAIGSIQLLSEQKLRLETSETEAAFDSELACLWWPDDRLRFRWHDNPLHYHARFAAAGTRPGGGGHGPPPPARTLMVARVDAPSEKLAHDLIATSVRVEASGLRGGAAVDARGKPPTDAYGRYDETLRELAAALSASSPMKVTLDDREAVFPPGAVKDVALYCGWYNLRHYVPGMSFAPGAVGYHVASLELLSLHNPAETGWARGLMADGVVATVGAVAEPYLHAFPRPDEFFPLLATGRLTLAEVYWLTNPLVSWMTTCVGDPLYTPYATNPANRVGDVAPRLRVIFTGSP
jgi:uncharacterized protein (TIGR03790 family)